MNTMAGGFCLVPWAVADDPRLTLHAKATYMALCRFSDRKGTCFPSLATLSEKTRISPAQLKRSLIILETHGYISRERRRGKRGNESTLYRLLPTGDRASQSQSGIPQSQGEAPQSQGRVSQSQGEAPQSQPLATTEPTLGPVGAPKKNHVTITREQEKREEKDSVVLQARVPQEKAPVVPRENAPQEKALILAVIELYHRMLPGLPAVRLLSAKRRRAIGSLISADSAREDLGWWQEFFNIVARSPWLLGENSRGWTADLDWLLAEGNMAKVLEGKYLPRAKAAKAVATARQTRRYEGPEEWKNRILAELNIKKELP